MLFLYYLIKELSKLLRFIIHMLFGDCQNYFVHHYIPLSQNEYSSIINVIKTVHLDLQ